MAYTDWNIGVVTRPGVVFSSMPLTKSPGITLTGFVVFEHVAVPDVTVVKLHAKAVEVPFFLKVKV